MASPDLVLTAPSCDGVALPVNPFVSNRYHFGMLLGVADLDTDQGYHRGKTWLHTSWLHGYGTVWGLRVELRAGSNELAVGPGLAVDRRGRELSVTDPLCVDLGLWFAEHRPESLVATDDGAGGVAFDLELVLCSRQCLDRPVPAISEGCEGATSDTAYSRAVEQGLPVLQPRPEPGEPDRPYPRVHQLMGLAEASDPLVVQALADLAAADPPDRPALGRRLLGGVLAADAIERAPAGGIGDLFPEPEPGCVALADLHVHLAPQAQGWRVVEDGADPTTVDNLTRPVLAPTALLQNLLVPPAAEQDALRRAGLQEPEDGGPQLLDATLDGTTLTVRFSAPLNQATVQPAAFTVTALRADGWRSVAVNRASAADDATTVTLTLGSAVRVRPVRVIAHGTGGAPVLGQDGSLLDDGHDAAVMIRDEE